jgi:dihydrofolate reductase
MTRFVSSASMSLDGFIADDQDGVGALFDWYTAGDIEVGSANRNVSFRLTAESAEYWRSWTERLGAIVVGRRLFDITDGWGGAHPLGVPVVVLTHQPPTEWSPPGAEQFHFVGTGIADGLALAGRIAGERVVAVAAGTVAGQALAAGLLDGVAIDLVPLLMGSGKRYFGETDPSTVTLTDPVVVPAHRVTHLFYEL